MLFQQFNSLHHPVKRGATHLVATIFVVKILWPVDRDANEKVILFKEFTPIIVQQGAVGLNGIVYLPSTAIFFLQFYRLPVKGEGPHQRFTAMPGEHHLRHGLRFNILLNKTFKKFFAHHLMLVRIEAGLFQVVAIVAIEIAL